MNYFVCGLQVGCVLLIVVSRCGMFVIGLVANGLNIMVTFYVVDWWFCCLLGCFEFGH